MEEIDTRMYADAIVEHARYLGMDPDVDQQYLYLAEESLKAEVPAEWEVGTSPDGFLYFFNAERNESMWEHPLDEHYRQLYKAAKSRAQAGVVLEAAAANTANTSEVTGLVDAARSATDVPAQPPSLPSMPIVRAQTPESDGLAPGPSFASATLNFDSSDSEADAVSDKRTKAGANTLPQSPPKEASLAEAISASTALVESAEVKPLRTTATSISDDLPEELDGYDNADIDRVMTGELVTPPLTLDQGIVMGRSALDLLARSPSKNPLLPIARNTVTITNARGSKSLSPPSYKRTGGAELRQLTVPRAAAVQTHFSPTATLVTTVSPSATPKIPRKAVSTNSLLQGSASPRATSSAQLSTTARRGNQVSSPKGDSILQQKRIDRAVEAATEVAELEIAKLRAAAANAGAKAAALVGRARAEREEWKSKGQQLQIEVLTLQEKLAATEAELSLMGEKLNAANEQVSEAQSLISKSVAALEDKNRRLTEEVTHLSGEAMLHRSHATEEAAARKHEVEVHAAEMKVAQESIEAVKRERNALEAKLYELESSLTYAKDDVGSRDTRLSEMTSMLALARESRDKLDGEVSRQRAEHMQLESANVGLKREVQAVRGDNAVLKQRVDELQGANEALTAEVDRLSTEHEEVVGGLEQQLRELKLAVSELKTKHDVAVKDVANAHQVQLNQLKQERATDVAHHQELHLAEKAALQENHRGALAAASAQFSEKQQALQARINALEAAMADAETAAAMKVARTHQENLAAAAARLQEVQADYDNRVAAIAETHRAEVDALRGQLSSALDRAADVEGRAKVASIEFQVQKEQADRRIRELTVGLASVERASEERVRKLEDAVKQEQNRRLEEVATLHDKHRQATAQAQSAHEEELVGLHAEADQLRAAVSDLTHGMDQAVRARQGATRAAADAEARAARLMDALTAAQTELQSLRHSVASAATDPHIAELTAQLRAKDDAIGQLTADVRRSELQLRTTEEQTRAQLDALRSSVAERVAREVDAARTQTANDTAAEWKSKMAVELSELTIAKEAAVRKATLADTEVNRLEKELDVRVAEARAGSQAAIATLQGEIERLISSNQGLVGLLQQAQEQSAKLQLQLHVQDLHHDYGTRQLEQSLAQSRSRSVVRIVSPRQRATSADDANRPQGASNESVQIIEETSTDTVASLRSQVALLAAEIREMRNSPERHPLSANLQSVGLSGTRADTGTASVARLPSAFGFTPAPSEPASHVEQLGESRAGAASELASLLTERALQSQDAGILAMARRLQLSHTTANILNELGLSTGRPPIYPERPGASPPDAEKTHLGTSHEPSADVSHARSEVSAASSTHRLLPSNLFASPAAVHPSNATLSDRGHASLHQTMATQYLTPLHTPGSRTSSHLVDSSRRAAELSKKVQPLWYQPGYWETKYGTGTIRQ